MRRARTRSAWFALRQLLRLRLAVFVALSALTGYVLAAGFRPQAAVPALACLLLAAGASALNQYQERDLDGRLARTAARPLPSGQMRPATALVLAWVLIATGAFLLVATGRPVAILLGAAAIGLYNGCYTPLKRVTAFAAVPGALIGCLGPAIGWAVAGGPVSEGASHAGMASVASVAGVAGVAGVSGAVSVAGGVPSPNPAALFALMLILYLWQVPHFWVLQMRHQEGYERAGLPTVLGRLGPLAGPRVVFTWAVAALTAPLLLPLFGSLLSPWTYGVLLVAALVAGAACAGIVLCRPADARVLRRSFAGINLFVLATLILIMVDRGLRP